jgi:hypothetical protein
MEEFEFEREGDCDSSERLQLKTNIFERKRFFLI